MQCPSPLVVGMARVVFCRARSPTCPGGPLSGRPDAGAPVASRRGAAVASSGRGAGGRCAVWLVRDACAAVELHRKCQESLSVLVRRGRICSECQCCTLAHRRLPGNERRLCPGRRSPSPLRSATCVRRLDRPHQLIALLGPLNGCWDRAGPFEEPCAPSGPP